MGPRTESNWIGEQFESHRSHLFAVAYRMLGSVSEAEDAVQGAWLRLSRTEANRIDNLGGWLTVAVGRESIDMLRARTARRDRPLEAYVPDPIITRIDADPEAVAIMADSVGLAMLVVLETMTPAERIAFVLHDVFGVPFEDIAPIVERSPEATRQLASRARRRTQGTPLSPGSDRGRQQEIVDAFFAAARHGDFDALVMVLDPDVVLRVDSGIEESRLVRGAEAVAQSALMFADPARHTHSVLVNGSPGVVVTDPHGEPLSIMGFTLREGRIIRIDALVDRARFTSIDLSAIG